MYCHIWFVTKYRKVTLVGETERRAKKIFAEIIQRHEFRIPEFETNRDHVHMLIEASSGSELSGIIRTLKSVSARELLKETSRCRVGNLPETKRSFWARRYGCNEVSEREIENIREYIRDQKKILHKLDTEGTTGGSL